MTQKVRIRDYKETDFAGIATVWKETHLGGTERGDDAAAIRRTRKFGFKYLGDYDVYIIRDLFLLF